MTDIYDIATEAEEKDRARALAIALRVAEAPRDYEAAMCPGCNYMTETNYGKGCDGWADCLADMQKRERAVG